jgi:spermidine synthase
MNDRVSGFPEGVLAELLSKDAGYFLTGGRLLEAGRSRWQSYEVWETRRFGRLYRLDGCFMASEGDEFLCHENLIHVPGIAHAGLRRALIIGGGDGGSAEELLKYPTIELIVIAELDAKVIELSRRYLAGVHHGALDDPRVDIHIGDGLAYVGEHGPAAGARFDLIVFDLTDPAGPAAALHTQAFFAACKALLTEGGAIVLQLGSPFFQPERVRELVSRLRQEYACVRPYFVHVPLYGGLWGMACASDALDPQALTADAIDHRLAERGIERLQHFNGAVHCAQFALPNHLRALLA